MTSLRTCTASPVSTGPTCRRRAAPRRLSTRSSTSPSSSRAAPKATLVATGPLTNVGLAFATHPEARPDRIVLMGGAVGEGNRTPAAEFNIWADPEAAQRVFAEKLDTTMVGLDVTHRALITDAHTERMRGAGRVGRVVAELMDFYARFHKSRYPDLAGSPMHDPVCIAHLIDPTLLDVRDAFIEVDCTHRAELGPHERRLAKPRALRAAERQGRARHRRRALRRARRRTDQQLAVIVFAAIAPHGGPVFDEPEGATRKGMEELGHRFASERPEAVIVVTPHGVHVDGHFAVVRSVHLAGDASQWTDADTQLRGAGRSRARRRLRPVARRRPACRRSGSRSERPPPDRRRCRSTGAR